MYGLVLGGGGAKGAYQVGCLKAFEELKIKFIAISGSSIGAINGLFYLSNSLDVMEDKWKELKGKDFLTIEDDNLLDGIFGRTSFMNLIDEYIDFNKFYKSNIPLFVTIAGEKGAQYILLNNKKPEEIKKYIEATSAIPIVYNSVNIKGKNYVDGGLFDNLPEIPLVRNNIKPIISIPLDGNIGKYSDINISPSVDLGGLISGALNFSKMALKNRLDLGYYDTLTILNNKFDLGLNTNYLQSEQLFLQQQLKLSKTTDRINEHIDILNKYLK